jgi:hypothetical protein
MYIILCNNNLIRAAALNIVWWQEIYVYTNESWKQLLLQKQKIKKYNCGTWSREIVSVPKKVDILARKPRKWGVFRSKDYFN